MRDILIFAIVFASLPMIFYRPYIGVLVWSWLGYMNPHRLTWGFAYDFPFAQIVGAVTIVAMVFSREKKTIPVTGVVIAWLAFVFWMNVSTVFSIVPQYAWEEWDRTMKIQLFSLITVMLMKGRERINYLVIVIAGCIGFFGVKGGIFSVLTGGSFRVWGPPGSFIEGNNAMGLAMVMVIPLMWYLVLRVEKRLHKMALMSAIGLTMLAILTTHSRGAFLAIGAMVGYLWLKSRHKLSLGVVLVLALPVLFFAMPDAWHERMGTILEYESDGSAMGRINAWWFAYYLALDHPFTGGGFQTFVPRLFLQYAPNPEDFHDAHSIYFEVLGEHGFVGLLMFLILGVAALQAAGKVAKQARSRGDVVWIVDLATMLQASLVGYAVGGLFLGLAYFDLYYHLIVLIVLLQYELRSLPATEAAAATVSSRTQSSEREPTSGPEPDPGLAAPVVQRLGGRR